MTLSKKLIPLLTISFITCASHTALAHCDTIDGPVAVAAQKSLETGILYFILPYAPASAED